LRPGSTLSLHGCQWLLARRFTPERRPVSADIAELRCSVCGMELRRGKEVSPCQCGALYHFERAVEGKDNGDLLDCYAEAKVCHSCKQEISLETRLLPDPKSLGF
jgi:hypothetical protein